MLLAEIQNSCHFDSAFVGEKSPERKPINSGDFSFRYAAFKMTTDLK